MASEDLMDSEITQFAQMQQQKVALQEGMMKVNNICFDKCITGKPPSSLDSWTEGCISNCVGRYMDAQKFILNRLQQKASNMG